MSFAPEAAFPGRAKLRRVAVRAVKRALDGRGRLLCALLTVAASGYFFVVQWREVPHNLLERTAPVDASLLGEARRLGLGYEDVLRDPAAAVDKPVLWCFYRNGETAFVEGRQSRALAVENLAVLPLTNTGIAGYCQKALAVVTGVGRGVVRVRVLGLL